MSRKQRKITSVLARRRLADEVPTLRAAVRNHCLECCGYDRNEVKACTAPACWLWPWRLGRTPKALKRVGGGGNLAALQGVQSAKQNKSGANGPGGGPEHPEGGNNAGKSENTRL